MRTKLTACMQCLQPKELKGFRRFVAAFSRPESPDIRLLDYLKYYHPNYDDHQLTFEKAFAVAFPEREIFKKKSIENKMSDLMILLKKFLIITELEHHDPQAGFWLARAFKRRKANQLFFKQLDAIDRLLEVSGIRDTAYHKIALKVAHERYYHPGFPRHKKTKARKALEQIRQNLNAFHTLSALKYEMEARQRKMILSEDLSITKIEMAERLKNWKEDDNPLVSVYLSLMHCLEDDRIEGFESAVETVKNKIGLLSPEGQADLFGIVLNIAIEWMIKGRQAYRAQVMKLYHFGIDHQILLYEGYLPNAHFLNLVTLGCTFGNEIEWVQSIIHRAPLILAPENRDATIAIAQANIDFVKGDFRKVFDGLTNQSFNSLSASLQAKPLLVRALYELETRGQLPSMNDFEDHLNAYKSFIRGNPQIKNDLKRSNLNFINLLFRLYRNKNASSKRKQQLLWQIQSTKLLFSRDWFTQKVKELGEKVKIGQD